MKEIQRKVINIDVLGKSEKMFTLECGHKVREIYPPRKDPKRKVCCECMLLAGDPKRKGGRK